MAWSSNYDGSKILTINEMNSAKSGYNIFSSSSDRCPTKSELLATSVKAGNYTYTVTISNAGSFANDQLVPNTNLDVKSTLNSYQISIACTYIATNAPTAEYAKAYWNSDGSSYSWACDAQVSICTGTGGATVYNSEDLVAEFSGNIVSGYPYLQNVRGTIGTYFTVPASTVIKSVKVTFRNGASGTITFNIPSASQGIAFTATFSGNFTLSASSIG